MKRVLFTAAGVIFFSTFATPASSQQPSGRTVGVSPAAYADGPVGYRLLALQQAVFMGDRLQTGASGEAQLLFNDDTRLVVGPNASLVIDSFVVRDGNKLRSFALTALRGVYRFSTGNGPKAAYDIRTPAMTLGIRGTQFDFHVAQDGSTDFVLISGSARVCDRFGNCLVARDPCTFVRVPMNAPLHRASGTERSERLGENFPYVAGQQGRLRRDFWFDVRSCGAVVRAQRAPETHTFTSFTVPVQSASLPTSGAVAGPARPGPGPAPGAPPDRGGPGNGNGNGPNLGNGGGNVQADGGGPGSGNGGHNNGQGRGADNGGGGHGSAGGGGGNGNGGRGRDK